MMEPSPPAVAKPVYVQMPKSYEEYAYGTKIIFGDTLPWLKLKYICIMINARTYQKSLNNQPARVLGKSISKTAM